MGQGNAAANLISRARLGHTILVRMCRGVREVRHVRKWVVIGCGFAFLIACLIFFMASMNRSVDTTGERPGSIGPPRSVGTSTLSHGGPAKPATPAPSTLPERDNPRSDTGPR